jgi:hypothetical protein
MAMLFLLLYIKLITYINYWTNLLMFRGVWKRVKQGYTEEPSLEASTPSTESGFDGSLAKKTHFPEFDLESIPDGELTDVSASDDEDHDDEAVVQLQRQEEKYATKEDQDVAVFLTLAKKMSLKSVLHLLQAQVMAQTLPRESFAKSADDSDVTTTKRNESSFKKPLAKRQKQFRFAEVSDHQVRVVVHEVECWKDMKELWMRPEEAHAIRTDLIQTVQFFRKNRPLYTHAVEIVAQATEPESIVEQHMRQLTEDSFARGLEGHIVNLLSANRKETVRAVLQEQSECKSSKDNHEMTSHCLREQSLAYSKLSTGFAEKMARIDQIEALKANMSRWRPGPQTASSAFWNKSI